jgi:hypothetical protein
MDYELIWRPLEKHPRLRLTFKWIFESLTLSRTRNIITSISSSSYSKSSGKFASSISLRSSWCSASWCSCLGSVASGSDWAGHLRVCFSFDGCSFAYRHLLQLAFYLWHVLQLCFSYLNKETNNICIKKGWIKYRQSINIKVVRFLWKKLNNQRSSLRVQIVPIRKKKLEQNMKWRLTSC